MNTQGKFSVLDGVKLLESAIEKGEIEPLEGLRLLGKLTKERQASPFRAGRRSVLRGLIPSTD